MAKTQATIDDTANQMAEGFQAQTSSTCKSFSEEIPKPNSDQTTHELETSLLQGDRLVKEINGNLEYMESTVAQQQTQIQDINGQKQLQAQHADSNNTESTTAIPKPKPPEGGEG